jgi:hypothetical protein
VDFYLRILIKKVAFDLVRLPNLAEIFQNHFRLSDIFLLEKNFLCQLNRDILVHVSLFGFLIVQVLHDI